MRVNLWLINGYLLHSFCLISQALQNPPSTIGNNPQIPITKPASFNTDSPRLTNIHIPDITSSAAITNQRIRSHIDVMSQEHEASTIWDGVGPIWLPPQHDAQASFSRSPHELQAEQPDRP